MTLIDRRRLLKSASATACATALGLGRTSIFADEATTPKAAANANHPYSDAKFVSGAPPLPAKGSFSVVVLPDTQFYSQLHPATFHAQTEWIVANAKDRKIAAVLHLGDITSRSTRTEWEVARSAMSRLDGIVPYFMVPGNHDYSESRCIDRTTLFNEYFPLKQFEDTPTFGGTFDQEPERFENSFHTFSAGGRDFLVIALEYGPRREVVRWANEIAAKHEQHEAILITHAYMYYDNDRHDWKKYGEQQRWNPHASVMAKTTNDDVNDGEELWQNLVSKQSNFILTLNGHVLNDGLGYLLSENTAGRNVHQVLVNFQMKPRGGDGWLRLLEFSAGNRTIHAIDYSPTRNECNVSKDNAFSMHFA